MWPFFYDPMMFYVSMWSFYLQRIHGEHGVFYLCKADSEQRAAKSYGVTVTDTLPAEPLLHCTCMLAVPCPPMMVPPVTIQVYAEPPAGAV